MSGFDGETVMVVAVGVVGVGAPVAYLVLTALDLREGIAAWRARHPCAVKLVKGVCHAVLFFKVLLM